MGVISRLSGLFNHLRAFAATAQAKSGDKPPKTGDRQAIAHEGIGDSPAQTGDKQAIGRLCAKGLSRPLVVMPGAAAGACRIQLRDCPWGVESARRGTVPSSVVHGLRTALTAVCLRAGTVPRGGLSPFDARALAISRELPACNRELLAPNSRYLAIGYEGIREVHAQTREKLANSRVSVGNGRRTVPRSGGLSVSVTSAAACGDVTPPDG